MMMNIPVVIVDAAGSGQEFLLLDDLLRRWHGSAKNEGVGTGYAEEDTTCREAGSNWRQWAEVNEACEASVRAHEADAMEGAWDSLTPLHRASVQHWLNVDASEGAAVWRNPRLPEDSLGRSLLLYEAKTRLRDLLRQRSVNV